MASINLQISRKAVGTYAAIVETFLDPITRKKTSRTIKSYGNIKHLEGEHEDVMAFLYQERDRLRRDPMAVKELRSEINNRIFPVVSQDEKEQAYKAAARLFYGDAAIRTVWEDLNLPQWFNKLKYNASLSYDLDLAVFYMTACRILMPASRRKMKSLAPQFLFDYNGHLSLDNLYDALARIGQGKRKDRLMEYLEKQTSKIVDRDTSLVFYDVTTFYFESFEPDNLRARGMSKEHRTHETQVVLGLLIDRNGIPLSYELYKGNEPETRTLLPIVNAYKTKLPGTKVIVVADRGLNSKSNLTELTNAGCEYIVAHSLHRLTKKMQDELFDDSDWKIFADHETAEVTYKFKIMQFPEAEIRAENNEASDDQDDSALGEQMLAKPTIRLIVNWSSKRYYNDIKQLNAQWEAAKKLFAGGTGAINAAFKRGSRQFLKTTKGKTNQFELNEELYKNKTRFAGYYGLVSTCNDISSEEIYAHLRELWRIEENFRVMKTVLQARPIFVRKEEHIRGHFVVCILALTIERLMHKRLTDAGEHISFEFLRELLLAPTVSPIRGARNKELMYLKTGLFINQDPEHESPVLLDMVAEAERVMGHFGIKPMMTLESVINMRRCRPVKLPFAAV